MTKQNSLIPLKKEILLYKTVHFGNVKKPAKDITC
jgi:hypothetical protein